MTDTATAHDGIGLDWGVSWHGAAPKEPARVLVVEPRSALRAQIGIALEHAGMAVDFATRVEEARTLLAAHRYSAAVIDSTMESGLGLSLCRELSRGAHGARTPVVVLHERGGMKHWLRARLAGARACLVRPLPLERFVHSVHSAAHASLPHPLLPRIL